ncbi:MAG: RNA polymerase sigma factor [Bacteroidota bacterium]|nr:RNA polymerase sigma factor [Bacteroidota bacterium]MDP4230015.1 RNA polymerase sigma factor [Bacteroidota bacterium]MDP4234824.1 RNA polymerase sigma factor [Bacteroidota bacterium]
MQKDTNLFWNLIEENRAPLWRFALGLTRSRYDAKDLVSETVLAAYTNFPKLREIAGFRKYLYTIASRTHKRKAWRHRIFASVETAAHLESQEMRESSHDLELLMKALDLLPPKQKEAVLLFEISGLSLEEIREVQGGTLSGVKSRVKRGREQLQRLLADRSEQVRLSSQYYEFVTPSMTLY